MRFASCLFVAVALLVAGSVAFVSCRVRSHDGRPSATATVPLTAADAVRLQRLAAKQSVTRQVNAGALTLLEAGAWFKYIDGAPSAREDCRPEDAGLSEGERYCRQVIRWAEADAKDTSTALAEQVVHRLDAELEADRTRDAMLTLPAPK